MSRTLAAQTPEKIDEQVILKGWVHSIRTHGKVNFLDLRDRSGLVQVVTKQDISLKPETVVQIKGKVVERPEDLINEKIVSGTVEVQADQITTLAKTKDLPLPIDGDGKDINEEIRFKYRYLDLRRSRLQENLKLRSDYVQATREYFFENDFLEIETPILTKSTPEGSRDFVVPSRKYPGKFFALPQSPQQYKQLLMTAGFERYFQIARCIRDEDPRADRAYEHTQVDMEMSFATQQDIMQHMENMIIYALDKVGYKDKLLDTPFPVYTYQEAMEKFGADKFDLRSKEQKQEDKLAFAWVVDFPFFEKTKNGDWTFSHNPFSAPKPEHEEMLLAKENIQKITTQQYDLVCNGYEVAGGSIRTHKPEVLRTTFQIMGYDNEEINKKFGHMLEAFTYGTPPHGGCAHGFERLLMAMRGEDYIREVQAFPQTGKGRTSVMEAPSPISKEQLKELHLKIKD